MTIAKGRALLEDSNATVKEVKQSIAALEFQASLPREESESFKPNNPLIDLENKAREEYKNHHTNLT